jgi:toxin ParE1/3/4
LPKVFFSRLALSDLKSIDEYTEATWGIKQAERYLDDLQSFCSTLAQTPGIGKVWTEQRPLVRRAEHRKHVVFFA